jgi:uncharacterized protein (TIGR04255 family)
MFPHTDRVVFKKNPLAEVVCQLRFPPILKVSREPVGFQELVRKTYTEYGKEVPVVQGVEIPRALLTKLQAQMGLSPVHVFSTPEKHARHIKLSRDSLSLIETAYRDWETFGTEFCRVEGAFRSEYDPAHYTRVGLLYRNIIDPVALGLGENPDWSKLIRKRFLGLVQDPDLSQQVTASMSETTLALKDESNSSLKLNYGLVHRKENKRRIAGYMICADFFANGKVMPDDFKQLLDGYNRIMGNLFRWAITGELRQALEPMD